MQLRQEASQHHAETRHRRCSAQGRASVIVRASRSNHTHSTKHVHSRQHHHRSTQPGQHQPPSSRHHAETRHPGTADAAHRHARAGLREQNGPKLTRGARATRPTTSQHRVGRRRRGSDERRRTLLFARELLDAFQQRELRCRYFLPVRSLGVSLGVALEPPNRARQTPPTQRSTPVCSANPSRKKICPLWATPNRE